MNPNDNSAKYYDIIYKTLKPQAVTEEELSLVESYLNSNNNILDIACGTGRHLISLAQKGYSITGVESSEGMIKEAKSKIKDLEFKNALLIQEDIFKVNLQPTTYNLITLFWNSFNEICLSEEESSKLLEKCSIWLKDEGRIIINIDDSRLVDPSKFDFNFEIEHEGIKYNLSWKTLSYDPETNTSVSNETIEVLKNNLVIEKIESKIKQRYWSLEEIQSIANKLNLKVATEKLNTSDELYIILEKK